MPTSSTSTTAVYNPQAPTTNLKPRLFQCPMTRQWEFVGWPGCICATTCGAKARRRWRKRSRPVGMVGLVDHPCTNVRPVFHPLHVAYPVVGPVEGYAALFFYQRMQEVTVIPRLAPFLFILPLVALSVSTGRTRCAIPSIPWFFIPLPMSSLLYPPYPNFQPIVSFPSTRIRMGSSKLTLCL